MSETKESSPVLSCLGTAAMLGYIAAVVMGRLIYGEELPWGTMLAGEAVLCIPLAVFLGVRGRTDKAWDGWTAVALMFAVSALGAVAGLVLGG